MKQYFDLPVTIEQIALAIQQMNSQERKILLSLIDAADAGSDDGAPEPRQTQEGKLALNGINGLTGRPLSDVSTPWDLYQRFMRPAEVSDEVRVEFDRLLTLYRELVLEREGKETRGVVEGVNPLKPEEAGWGILFPNNTPVKVVEALRPLVNYRQEQCKSKANGFVTEYWVDPLKYTNGYEFRHEYGQEHGAVNPAKLPYYFLIVGPPTELSFAFQYGLDTQHAVGRIHFGGPDEYDVDGYCDYVQRLLSHENNLNPVKRQSKLTFFSTAHDRHTTYSDRFLAESLAAEFKRYDTDDHTFTAEHIRAEAATKSRLYLLLKDERPAFIFTATHGLGFPSDAHQAAKQGAILCQGSDVDEQWVTDEAVPASQFLAASDIDDDIRLDGAVIFAFGCYTAGTPRLDDYPYLITESPSEIAEKPFVAQLPQRLLRQGALAFVGHVERAWFYSYSWPGVKLEQTDTFKSVIRGLLAGHPVGDALEDLQLKYLDMNNSLTEKRLIQKYGDGDEDVEDELIRLWTACTDARSYILLGDPLASLRPEGPKLPQA